MKHGIHDDTEYLTILSFVLGGWIHGSKPLHILMHTVICHKFAVMFEVIGAPNVPSHRTDIYETLYRHLVLLMGGL